MSRINADMPPILVDTREPKNGRFLQHFSGPHVRGTIRTGDFSLPGCEDYVAVERKAIGDLVTCLSQHRERFERELKRAQCIPDFIVIVEATWDNLWRGDYPSDMRPLSAWESVIAFQMRYRIPFLFSGSVGTAARLCESYLLRWWKEHYKAIVLCQNATTKYERNSNG